MNVYMKKNVSKNVILSASSAKTGSTNIHRKYAPFLQNVFETDSLTALPDAIVVTTKNVNTSETT